MRVWLMQQLENIGETNMVSLKCHVSIEMKFHHEQEKVHRSDTVVEQTVHSWVNAMLCLNIIFLLLICNLLHNPNKRNKFVHSTIAHQPVSHINPQMTVFLKGQFTQITVVSSYQ